MITQSIGTISISLLALAIIIIILIQHILKERKERTEETKKLKDENQLLKKELLVQQHRYDDIHNALKDKILELKSEKSKNEKLLKKQTKGKKDERKKTRTT